MIAAVETKGGLPQLLLDGVPVEPVLFFANTEIGRNDVCEKEIRMAAAHGIHLYSVCCHLPVWEPRGRRDFGPACEALELTLRSDPEARILLRVNLSIYGGRALEWDRSHPGDAMRFAFEVPGAEDATNGNYAGTAVTLASDDWLDAAMDTLSEFNDRLKSRPRLYDALMGYHIAAGETGEWFHCSLRERGIDLGETNRRQFIRYLENTYGSIGDLCRSWGLEDGAYASFQEIGVPADIDGNDRSAPAARTLFTRRGDRRFTDYADYSSEIVADRILRLARHAKEITDREKLAVFFYGYHFDLYDARTGHFRVEKVLNCGDIDAFSSPICYTDRNQGGVGALMSPADSFVRAGKLWFVENDIRTCMCLREEKGYDWVPKVPSLEALFEVYKREFAQMLAHGLGCWYMDLLAEGWQYHPDIWALAADLKSRYFGLLSRGGPLMPDVAVIVDERAMSLSAHAEATGMNLLYGQRLEFWRTGLKFGLYTAEDYEQRGVKARLAVYLDPFAFTAERAGRLRARLREDRTDVLFMHGFGTASRETVRILTGLDIEVLEGEWADLSSTPEDGFLPAGKAVLCGTLTDGGRPRGSQRADPVYIARETEGVTVLVRFDAGRHRGRPSLVYAADGERKMYFCSAMALTADALREIARISGVPVYHEGDDTCIVGNAMVTLHTRTGGEKTIRLPFPGNGTELYTGLCASGSAPVTFHAEPFKTYTFVPQE